MEWATRIEKSSQGLLARIVDIKGPRMASLNELVSTGLPRERGSRLVLEQNVGEWRQTDPSEYPNAFALHSISPAENSHAVYETTSGRTRVLIPALALMRAFFRPTRYLLAQMFLPQALDRVRVLDVSLCPPRVEFLTPTWRNLRANQSYGDVATPISWLSVFPSAMRFAASVHVHAREERIGVTLPQATVKMALQGRTVDQLFLTTNVTLLEIAALEAPLEWAANHPLTIFRRGTHVPTTQSPVLKVEDVPRFADGSVDVTDDEWRCIEPILYPPAKSRRPTRHDPRQIFNGVLRKLVLGTAWQSTAYVVGSPTNALFAYRQWNHSGALPAALAVLGRCRKRMAA